MANRALTLHLIWRRKQQHSPAILAIFPRILFRRTCAFVTTPGGICASGIGVLGSAWIVVAASITPALLAVGAGVLFGRAGAFVTTPVNICASSLGIYFGTWIVVAASITPTLLTVNSRILRR